ncbi:MAG: hypothetical protein AAF439_11270 [Pseudomonadota bacterium]
MSSHDPRLRIPAAPCHFLSKVLSEYRLEREGRSAEARGPACVDGHLLESDCIFGSFVRVQCEQSANWNIRMGKGKLILLLVGLWVAAVGASFLHSNAVDASYHQHRFFEGIGVLVKWQLAAFLIALITAGTAIFARTAPMWTRWVGGFPLSLTVLLLLGIELIAFLHVQAT